MPVTPTYPGIYIEEIRSSAHTITAAPTSIAVFIGYSHPFRTRAPFGHPIEVFGFSDYETWFGGFFRSSHLDAEADLYGDLAGAVNQFFLNGGSDAFVVGLEPRNAGAALTPATLTIGPLTFTQREITDGDHQMLVVIGNLKPNANPDTADVTISFGPPSTSPLYPSGSVVETYRQVSLVKTLANGKPNPNYIVTQINGISALVTLADPAGSVYTATPADGTAFTTTLASGIVPWDPFGASNPVIFDPAEFIKVFQNDGPLDKVPIFNLMVIPGVTDNKFSSVLSEATAFCERKRAFLIMDPPRDASADGTLTAFPTKIEEVMDGTLASNPRGEVIPKSPNSAIYFPYLKSNDAVTGLAIDPRPSTGPVPFEIPPSGTVAGIFARTDLNRGVWKAPAGLETTLVNVVDVVDRGKMTDNRQGVLNNEAINAIRNFPGIGPVVFGARTSVARNRSLEQWKYVPVRRMTLFIEQTLYANLGWVVFEPNDVPLWTAIRTSINAFMLGLFRQQAFQGATPSDAFQVKCDSQTTTQADIDNGIVNIVVAFAPLKPAEFVVIKIAQLAGQTQTS